MLNSVYLEWFKKERIEPYAVGSVEEVEGFLRLIPRKKKRVLVIGCGEGHEVDWFNKHGFAAVGVTANKSEAINGKKKYGVEIVVKDMHDLGKLAKFDAIYASNVLEHSPMPFLALYHWRKYLKKNGYLVVVIPSKEWLSEFYHYSVMTRSQMKDLLYKAGFELLAGPQMQEKIKLEGGKVFLDMGRGWGFQDAYLAKITSLPKQKKLKQDVQKPKQSNGIKAFLRKIAKWPYNKVRVWYAMKVREW